MAKITDETVFEDVEKILTEHKGAITQLEAPPELEERLKMALNQLPKTRLQPKGLAIVASFLILFFLYSYDAFAYYGKQLMGYEQVISGSLQNLNQLGKGQEINKNYTFSDGTVVTLDKIFFDANELVALYTENHDHQTGDGSAFSTVRVGVKGLLGKYHSKSGRGHSNDAKTQIAWVASFETPSLIEKWMSFTVEKQVGGKWESGKIPFTLERNKAIAYGIKEDLNQTISIENKQIELKTLTVTPLSTVIKGTFNNFSQDERLRFDLLVNGEIMESHRSGMSSKDFEFQFDGINEAHSIEIVNVAVIKEQLLDKVLTIIDPSQRLEIGNGEGYFVIDKISSQDGKTLLEISRKNNVEAVFGVFDLDKQLTEVSKTTLPDSLNQEKGVTRERIEYNGSSASLRLAFKVLQIKTLYEGEVGIL